MTIIVVIVVLYNKNHSRKQSCCLPIFLYSEVAAHLCLTLIIQELKISVEHDRVVTTLDIMKH
jgi:hypothetical protein